MVERMVERTGRGGDGVERGAAVLIGEGDRANLRLQAASSAAEAVELARDFPVRLVVAPLNAAGLDGGQLCAALKADPATRSVSVLLLGAPGEQDRALEAGADYFLTSRLDPGGATAALGDLIRLRQVLQQMSTGVLVVEAPSGQVLLANDRAQQVLGLDPGQLPRFGMARVLHVDGTPCQLQDWPLYRSVVLREVVHRAEFLTGAAGDRSETLGASSMPVRDSRGQVVAGVMTVQDISEVKRVEHRQRRESQEIAALSRAKSLFLDIVSHELRSPVQAVLTAAEVLTQPGATTEMRDTARQIITRNAARQARLLDDLTDLSRIERGRLRIDRRRADLGALLRSVAEEADTLARQHNVRLAAILPRGPLPVEHDACRVQQVLSNLLGNAFKYTPQGGTVTLEARLDPPWVEISVTDSGKGIDPDALERLFEPFYQAGRSDGLGIGLSISRALVEAHGGDIEVSSPGPGKGSRFTVRLPLAPPLRPAVRRRRPRPPSAEHH